MNKTTHQQKVMIPESKGIVIGHAMCVTGYPPTQEGINQFLLDSGLEKAKAVIVAVRQEGVNQDTPVTPVKAAKQPA